MPVWGARFFAETRNENAVRAEFARLVAYLQSIQTALARPQITRRARWIKRAGCQSGRPALGRGSIRFSRAPFCRVELGLAEPWVLR